MPTDFTAHVLEQTDRSELATVYRVHESEDEWNNMTF